MAGQITSLSPTAKPRADQTGSEWMEEERVKRKARSALDKEESKNKKKAAAKEKSLSEMRKSRYGGE